jgi:quinol monooxygenase YgiN
MLDMWGSGSTADNHGFDPELCLDARDVRSLTKRSYSAFYGNDFEVLLCRLDRLFEPNLMRFSELWPDNRALQRHLLALHIAPWREVCRAHGLLERKFTAYDTEGSRAV